MENKDYLKIGNEVYINVNLINECSSLEELKYKIHMRYTVNDDYLKKVKEAYEAIKEFNGLESVSIKLDCLDSELEKLNDNNLMLSKLNTSKLDYMSLQDYGLIIKRISEYILGYHGIDKYNTFINNIDKNFKKQIESKNKLLGINFFDDISLVLINLGFENLIEKEYNIYKKNFYKERVFQNILESYFASADLDILETEKIVDDGRADIYYKDDDYSTSVIELKIEKAKLKHVYQVVSYREQLKTENAVLITYGKVKDSVIELANREKVALYTYEFLYRVREGKSEKIPCAFRLIHVDGSAVKDRLIEELLEEENYFEFDYAHCIAIEPILEKEYNKFIDYADKYMKYINSKAIDAKNDFIKMYEENFLGLKTA